MKRTTIVLLVLFSLLAAAAAHASEAFILNIPLRFNASQETGEVRITLTLDATPAGAQLVVAGQTLSLGGTATIAGDSVAFATAGGNDVRITYKPLSNFSGDFCHGGAAVEKNIPMRFSGAQDVTEYRVTTYIVAAPNAECSQVSKHTGDAPATLIPNDDGVAPTLSATNRGRHPFDVVLVLDKSGSMADLPPGAGGGANKADILKSAATAFVAQWRQLDAPTPSGGEWSHDRIGLVFFDHIATPQTLAGGDPPASVFVKYGADGAPWDSVINGIGTLAPGGSTSIGGGINAAMQQWKNDPQNDLSLVVFTDGMQNTAPLITAAPSGFLSLTPVAGFPDELRKRFIPIQTIGFGAPAQVDEELLRNIALETSGVSYMAINATTVFDTFAQTLVAILKGNTVSLVLQRHGTVAGKSVGAPQPLVVDLSAQRIVVSVQWAPPLRNALELEVFRPGTSTPATPLSSEKTPQAALQTFNVGQGEAGTWLVRVKRAPARQTAAAIASSVPYTLNVLFLERRLDYQFSLDTMHPATGDALRVHALVSWEGKPLTGLPGGALRVRVERPGAALGTVLHDSHAKIPPPQISPGGEAPTAYDLKVAALLRTGLLERIAPKEVETIVLREEKKGVYSGVFEKTTVPGSYAFGFAVDWNQERTGHVQRVERLEQFVRAKPDRQRTEVRTSRDGGTVLISVTPRDRFGNYLGPGYASAIKLRLKSAGQLAAPVPVDRDQTGTYVFTLKDVPAGQPLDFELTVAGVEIGVGL